MAKPLSRPVVITFGRFNPPTSGHQKVIDYMVTQARRIGADVIVYPSVSHDDEKNPLTFRQRVSYLRKFLPAGVRVNDDANIKTPFDAFHDVHRRGYTTLYVAVGQDRVSEFAAFGRYFSEPVKDRTQKRIPMRYEVIAVPRAPGAISATIQRRRATLNQFPAFLRDSPDPRKIDVVRDLFTDVRRGMHMQESRRLREALEGFSFRLDLLEDGAVKPPTESQRLKARQDQEKIELQRRQSNELLAAKLRDVQQKAREQQQKSAAPKPATR